jgi:hypothetical protein
MRGADGVRDRLAVLLATEMPRKIPLLRQAWGVGAERLPDVDYWISGDIPEEMVSAGAWVVVVNPRLLRTVRTGSFSPAGEPEYRSRYACRIYVWTLGLDWNSAIDARDKLTACARLSLFQYSTLSTDGGDTGYLVHENTYTEDYGVPIRSKGSRCWAASIMSVDVDVEEFVDDGSTRPPIGVAEDVTPQTAAVGPTQPFPEE